MTGPSTLDYYAQMSNHGKLIEVEPRTGSLYIIPAYGFLEGVEIRFTPPVTNMDAAKPYRFIIEPIDGELPMQVFARVRSIKMPGES